MVEFGTCFGTSVSEYILLHFTDAIDMEAASAVEACPANFLTVRTLGKLDDGISHGINIEGRYEGNRCPILNYPARHRIGIKDNRNSSMTLGLGLVYWEIPRKQMS